jgi:hypothetical protein
MLEVVTELDGQLQAMADSIHGSMKPAAELNLWDDPQQSDSLVAILLHASYYDLLIFIHSRLVYPWLTAELHPEADEEVRANVEAQTVRSSMQMAAAARNLIIMSRNLDIDGASTAM